MPTTLTLPALLRPLTDDTNTAHPDACWLLASVPSTAQAPAYP